jgi:hypothetical protein
MKTLEIALLFAQLDRLTREYCVRIHSTSETAKNCRNTYLERPIGYNVEASLK